jgi:hypothetical protein
MANMLFANNANTTLASSLTTGATSMSVTSATGFPSPTGVQYFYCTLADAATQTTIEIVKVTSVTGTTFAITRGQDGTTGTAFAAGAVVSLRLVRASLNDFPKLDETNTFNADQAISGQLTSSAGLATTGTFTATAPSDGLVMDYATGFGRFSAFAGDGFQWYNAGIANTKLMQLSSSGVITTATWNGATVGVAYGGTGVTASSGANSVVLRDSNQNVFANNFIPNTTFTVASATPINLTVASSQYQVVTGSVTSQTFNMPDATTLSIGDTFYFNNNITYSSVQINAHDGSTSLLALQAGGAAHLVLLTNSTSNGTWDVHSYIPSTVSWGNATLNFNSSSSISGSVSWLGNAIGVAYGGTGQTSFTSGQLIFGNGTSGLNSNSNFSVLNSTFTTLGTSSSQPIIIIQPGASAPGGFNRSLFKLRDSTGAAGWDNVNYGDGANYLTWESVASSTATERMRLDTSGNLLVGGTSNITYPVRILATWDSRNSINGIGCNDLDNTGTGRFAIQFLRAGTIVGSVQTTGTTTYYVTSSDYRLKDNVAPLNNALETVSKLKPCTYTWKSDGSNGQGFIAHELQEVLPDCVTGEKDAVDIVEEKDSDGKVIGTKEVIKPQGIDTSFLVATLTAAIQELNNKFDAYVASHP